MRKFKLLTIIGLIGVMAFAFVGCGGDNSGTTDKGDGNKPPVEDNKDDESKVPSITYDNTSEQGKKNVKELKEYIEPTDLGYVGKITTDNNGVTVSVDDLEKQFQSLENSNISSYEQFEFVIISDCYKRVLKANELKVNLNIKISNKNKIIFETINSNVKINSTVVTTENFIKYSSIK